MPFEKSEFELPKSAPKPQIPAQPEELGFTDVIGDSMLIDNDVYAAYRLLKEGNRTVDLDSGFDPIDQADKDNVPLEYLEDFYNVNSESEYRDKLAQIDQELTARDRIGQAGFGGFMSTMVSATLSPLSLIPVGNVYKGLRTGSSLGKTMGSTALATGGVTFTSEKLLQKSQATRSDEEVAINTFAGATLGALVGGGALALNSRQMSKAADKITNDIKARMMMPDKLPETPAEMEAFGQSLSSATSTRTLEQLGLAKADGPIANTAFQAWTAASAKFSPMLRMLRSPSKTVRSTFQDVAEVSLETQAVKEGLPLPISVERTLKSRRVEVAERIESTGEIYKQYRDSVKGSGDSKMSSSAFREEIGKAVRQDQPHPNAFVENAAKEWRKFYDGLAKELIDLEILPADIVTPRQGARYLNRVWKTNALELRANDFKAKVKPWLRRQYDGFKADMEIRAKETKADGTPTEAAKNAQTDLRTKFDSDSLDDYIDSSVEDIRVNLMNLRKHAGIHIVKAGKSGPLKQRTFDIPDGLVEDFLDNDIFFLADRYARQVMPEIEFKNKFGDKTFEDITDDIIGEYNDLLKDLPDGSKKRKKLEKQRREDLKDLSSIWSLNKGTYRDGLIEPGGFIDKVTSSLLTLNYARMLGGVVVSSLPDTMMGVLRRGFSNFFGESLTPFVRNFKASASKRVSKRLARDYGVSIESVMASRAQSLYSIGDPMAFGTPFERAVGAAGSLSSKLNLINFWNDTLQEINFLGAHSRLVRNVNDFASGKTLPKKEQELLSLLGVGEDAAQRISAQLKKHGFMDEDSGLFNSHIRNWDDKEAAKVMRAAIGKEMDRTILTKGTADIPRFGNTTLGRIMFQFMNFSFAANNKIVLAGLQKADGQTLQGFTGLMGMGMLVYALKEMEAGRELSDNPAKWVEQGLDRSGMIAILAYGNSFAEPFGLGYNQLIGEKSHRVTSGSAVGKIFGPSAGTAKNIAGIVNMVNPNQEGITQSDVHRIRATLPWQNLFYLRGLLDRAEQGINKEFNIPKRRKRKRRND
jgi:hypothetical protein